MTPEQKAVRENHVAVVMAFLVFSAICLPFVAAYVDYERTPIENKIQEQQQILSKERATPISVDWDCWVWKSRAQTRIIELNSGKVRQTVTPTAAVR